jgi:hypothetical protein
LANIALIINESSNDEFLSLKGYENSLRTQAGYKNININYILFIQEKIKSK